MTGKDGRRTIRTFIHKRMVWPYVLHEYEDGRREVEVRDAICPRCRGKASYRQQDQNVRLACNRCNITENYAPYVSYDALKDAVAKMILASTA